MEYRRVEKRDKDKTYFRVYSEIEIDAKTELGTKIHHTSNTFEDIGIRTLEEFLELIDRIGKPIEIWKSDYPWRYAYEIYVRDYEKKKE